MSKSKMRKLLSNPRIHRLLHDPKYLGFILIGVFFVAFLLSAYANLTLAVFVICTISAVLSVCANIWDYKFLNSIVIGYWCIYLVTIADIAFGAGALGIHIVNLVLSTLVLIRRWRNTWPLLIFISGFLWATIIGTEKQVTNGESEYFRMFDWQVIALFIGFDLFMALVIWLAQNPKHKHVSNKGTRHRMVA